MGTHTLSNMLESSVGRLVARDYKDLLRSTKVIFRSLDHLADIDIKLVITRVGIQNPNIKISEWRVVGDN